MISHPLAEKLDIRLFPEPRHLDPLFCRKASRAMRDLHIDVLHLHRSKDLASFALLKEPPRILTLQIESTLQKKDLFHRFVYSRVDRILTITERMRGFAVDALPVHSQQVKSLHYGIDAQTIQEKLYDRAAIRRQWNIPEDALVIGLVGRLELFKGQDVLLKAFARIYDRYPNARILLAGEPSSERSGYKQTLQNLTEDLNIADCVHFIGFQIDTASVYSALDICVLASRQEAFGLVLIEAMAYGIPLVATAAGGVPEIIEDEVNGLLFPPGRPDALADALVRLIRNPDLCQKLALNGQSIVREKFSLQKHLQALEDHFHEVVEAGRCISSKD